MSEKKEYFCDPEKVEKLAKAIEKVICDQESIVIDAMTALISVMLHRTIGSALTKGELLGYISNAWELNDPENEHPLREKMPKIRY